MKIRTWVEFPGREIDVEVSAEDMVLAITDNSNDQKPVDHLKTAVSRFASFMNRVPDSVVDELLPAQRKIIIEFFETAAQRFRKNV